ncbi:MAG: alkyl sulfatase dimerization domain-containing protein, partial [Pseudomonadota bacterium]
PTVTFEDRLETEICGRPVVLQHAPGETDDQIAVYLSDEKILMPGDNIYRAFPNLYTIRGTSYRDVAVWAKTLDMLRAFGADHLAPSHTRPVSGAAAIDEILTAYADGIRFVHDQTVRHMNEGLSPDALVETVQLPPHLKNHPYLQEHYGTVRWSVRSIYDGYLGWFNGDGAFLNPANPAARADAFAAIAAAETSLADAAEGALNGGRHAIAAELATYAIMAGDDAERARAVKADALSAMGFASVSPNGRNYLLSQARELRGEIAIEEGLPDDRTIDFTRAAPIANFMAALPVNLRAEDALDIERVAEFRFTDVDETYTVEVRRGVAVVTPARAASIGLDADIVVETTSPVWIDILVGQRGAAGAIAAGTLKFPEGLGDVLAFRKFMALFSDA